MSERSQPTVEQVLYIGVFVLALALRVSQLGSAPLSEFEAVQAVRAFELAEGQEAAIGGQASYVLLTALNFGLLGSSEFLARIWPALLGAGLVLLPYPLRGLLGRKAALILSLGLAFSPGFVATSRMASSAILAVLFPMLAIVAWYQGRVRWAGFLAAVAVLSGPGSYIGLLGIYLTWLFLPRATKRSSIANQFAAKDSLRDTLLSFAITLLLGATAFLMIPQAVSGIGAGIAEFLSRWTQAQGLPIAYLLLALVTYSLPAMMFGLVGAVRAWASEDRVGQALSVWVLASFLIAMINPGRQATDLLWVLIPLWGLASRELSRYLVFPEKNKASVFGTLFLVAILVAFLWINASGMARLTPGEGDYNLRLIVSAALVPLAAVALILIGYGWSRQVATLGLVWGLGFLFLLFYFSIDMRIIQAGGSGANELWQSGPAAGQAQLLHDTAAELSDRTTGQKNELEVVLLSESPSLRWTFREWPSARREFALSDVEEPALIVVSGSDIQPEQSSAYRGQSFIWSSEPDWEGNRPPNFFAWFVFREAQTRSEAMTLWVRSDLFPPAGEDSLLAEQEVIDEIIE